MIAGYQNSVDPRAIWEQATRQPCGFVDIAQFQLIIKVLEEDIISDRHAAQGLCINLWIIHPGA